MSTHIDFQVISKEQIEAASKGNYEDFEKIFEENEERNLPSGGFGEYMREFWRHFEETKGNNDVFEIIRTADPYEYNIHELLDMGIFYDTQAIAEVLDIFAKIDFEKLADETGIRESHDRFDMQDFIETLHSIKDTFQYAQDNKLFVVGYTF